MYKLVHARNLPIPQSELDSLDCISIRIDPNLLASGNIFVKWIIVLPPDESISAEQLYMSRSCIKNKIKKEPSTNWKAKFWLTKETTSLS